ncbi:MAG: hypothetical protein L3K17_02405 [Thermoplasmata archaeon]|nr:hypothetical protein [Thermoplasmata archaeon]
MAPRTAGHGGGLASLRRSGRVTELLFLYECTTQQPTQLRPIAQTLGLTVQAASHSFRRLAERGLAEFRDGQYRPTVKGVAWLHDAFGQLTTDLGTRSGRLHVVQSTRAVALVPVASGDPVVLELRGGVLGARPGSRGASRGRAAETAAAGALVRVVELEGILPIPRGQVHIVTLPSDRLGEPRLLTELRGIAGRASGLLAAPGLETYHLQSQVTRRTVTRFGVGPACWESTRVGVDATVVLLEEELPRFLEQFTAPDPPSLTISRLGGAAPSRPRARRRPSRARPA